MKRIVFCPKYAYCYESIRNGSVGGGAFIRLSDEQPSPASTACMHAND